jgi:hypothetical protein
MKFFIVLSLLLAIAGDESDAARNKRLMNLHRADALEYKMYRDSTHKEKLELLKEPVYVWTNPVRKSQQGAVFLWTSRGRAEAVGTIFSSAGGGKRGVTHEFHSLSLGTLDVARQGTHEHVWDPKAPGIKVVPIEGASPPADSRTQRLGEMRSLAREFTASTRDANDVRWDLRLLAQPLYRYESTDSAVTDGALFAFVTSAGTDPEVLLVIEARRTQPGEAPVWHRGLARFTDLELTVRFKGRDVFSAPGLAGNQVAQYPRQEYGIYADRVIPEEPGSAAEGASP